VLGQLIAFLGVSVVVICTPGPDTALTVRNALAGGRASGVWTAVGVATGQAVWTVAASLGVAGLIRASEPAFLVMKAAGTLYLLYLGGQSLWAAWRDRGHAGPAAESPALPSLRLTPARSFRQGVINDLANPKMAAFFLSLLPQFASADRGAPRVLALGLLFCLLTFSWLAVYSVVVARMRRVLGAPRVRRALDALAGSVLVAFGVRLAFEER
jgi:threonine/homoserine/homoserine lactone efflux protein